MPMDSDLDLANINFAEIGDDLERFQEDDSVQQALSRGVDLKKYGQDLELELKEVLYHICTIKFPPYLNVHILRQRWNQ